MGIPRGYQTKWYSHTSLHLCERRVAIEEAAASLRLSAHKENLQGALKNFTGNTDGGSNFANGEVDQFVADESNSSFGIKVHVKDLPPLFEVDDVIELDCMTIYGKEKQKVFEVMSWSHDGINLTINIWTFPKQTKCITRMSNRNRNQPTNLTGMKKEEVYKILIYDKYCQNSTLLQFM